jgi:hypothetical protein
MSININTFFRCAVLVSLMLVGFSCKKKLTNPFNLGQPVGLKMNETADCADCKDVTVILLQINDNRCPKGVNCIQAGQADAIFQITGSINQKVEVSLGSRKTPSQVQVGGYTFTLESVEPYPVDGVKIPTDQKTATFVMEGA